MVLSLQRIRLKDKASDGEEIFHCSKVQPSWTRKLNKKAELEKEKNLLVDLEAKLLDYLQEHNGKLYKITEKHVPFREYVCKSNLLDPTKLVEVPN